jgi:hypothetical protein
MSEGIKTPNAGKILSIYDYNEKVNIKYILKLAKSSLV